MRAIQDFFIVEKKKIVTAALGRYLAIKQFHQMGDMITGEDTARVKRHVEFLIANAIVSFEKPWTDWRDRIVTDRKTYRVPLMTLIATLAANRAENDLIEDIVIVKAKDMDILDRHNVADDDDES